MRTRIWLLVVLASMGCAGQGLAQKASVALTHAATISGDLLGGSYCRNAGSEHAQIAVRGLTDSSRFGTNFAVALKVQYPKATKSSCTAHKSGSLAPGDKIEIKELDQNHPERFRLFVEGSGHAPDSPVAILNAKKLKDGDYGWLEGPDSKDSSVHYAVYLEDDPLGFSEIYKHYRVEVFEGTKCWTDEGPSEEIKGSAKVANFIPWTEQHPCSETPRPRPGEHETTSGDGYEPRHP